MKMLLRLILPLFLVNTFFSCKETPLENTNDAFVQEYHLNGMDCHFEESLFGNPNRILIKDSLLLIVDNIGDNKLLSVFNIKTGRLVDRLLPIGNGPNELIPPVNVLLDQNDLWIQERSKGVISRFTMREVDSTFAITLDAKFGFVDPLVGYVLPSGNNQFVAAGGLETSTLAIFDEKGELVSPLFSFPEANDALTPSERFIAYQGPLAMSPDKEHFVFGAAYMDWVLFFEKDASEQWKEIKRYAYGENRISFQNNRPNIPLDNVHFYNTSYATSSYCYLLRYNFTFGQGYDSSVEKRSSVLCFDWKGEPIAIYHFDRFILGFAVDNNSKILYGIDNTTGQIVQYHLP